MRAMLLVLALLAVGSASADDTVMPDLTPTYYDTLLEAAMAGVQMAYDRSNAYEYGGAIFRTTNGRYRVAYPDTDYRGDGVGITYDNDYAGYELAGDYHSHPCLPYSHWPNVFSDSDVNSSTRNGVPGFMADLCSGVVREFVPGVTPLDMSWEHDPLEVALARAAGVNLLGSHGVPVGRIKVTKLPVMQEIPGPITKARGMRGW